MKVALGCDPNAAELKHILIKHLIQLGHEAEDLGSEDVIYANVSFRVAQAVVDGAYDRGILICGTGIGVSIAANKVPGANAALCSDSYSTERAIKSNNSNIMALGSQVIGPQLAKNLVTIWINAHYEPGGRSQPKIERIDSYVKAVCSPRSP